MSQDAPKRRVRQHNVSLQPVESKALQFLAETTGRNGNRSAVVGGLIADHMERTYGEHWRQRVEDHANQITASRATV
jgi:RPA family protein